MGKNDFDKIGYRKCARDSRRRVREEYRGGKYRGEIFRNNWESNYQACFVDTKGTNETNVSVN